MELAIDTSSEVAGVALSDNGIIITEYTWYSGQNHTTELLPNIDKILHQKKIPISSINAIFVAKGPGTFNGLRVGVSSAKGFATALDIPILGLSTFEIESYPFASCGLPIRPIHDIGRDEIATALYLQNDRWQCMEKHNITSIDSLIQQVESKTLFCGELSEQMIKLLKSRLEKLAIIPSQAIRMRRSGYLAELGWQYLATGMKDDPISLQPVYLRQPPISWPKNKTIKK